MKALSLMAVLGVSLVFQAHAQPYPDCNNYSRWATFTASSSSSSTRGPEKMKDQNPATRWEASNSSPGTWVLVRMPQPVVLLHLRALEHGSRIRHYRIEYQNPVGTWHPLSQGTGTPQYTHPDGAPTVRFTALRLIVTKAAGQPSLAELDVFASGLPMCQGSSSSSSSSTSSTSSGGGPKLPGTRCADLGGFCSFSGTATAYIGSCLGDSTGGGCGFVQKQGVTGGIACTRSAFGLPEDHVFTYANPYCSFVPSSLPSSGSSSSSSSSGSSSGG